MASPINHANSAKTHCKYGHEYTNENTRSYRGSRFCLSCERIRNKTPDRKKQKSEAGKAYYSKNKDKLSRLSKVRHKKYYQEHKEEIAEKSKKYRESNPEFSRLAAKRYRDKNPEKVAAFNRSESKKTIQARYIANNKEKVEEGRRIFRASQRRKDYIKKWTRERYKKDLEHNIKTKIRRRIYMALRGIFEGRRDRSMELLGCTYAEFKGYIEGKFTEGMCWADCFSGKIHFDHIRPCASFDLTEPEQQKQCFHYTNMQPLWALDNLKKHAKYEDSIDTGLEGFKVGH